MGAPTRSSIGLTECRRFPQPHRLVDGDGGQRARQSLKRGGKQAQVPLDEDITIAGAPDLDLVALDDALKALSATDERRSRVVELRFFGGLNVEETAEVLNVSPETVMRDWKVARAWLFKELHPATLLPRPVSSS